MNLQEFISQSIVQIVNGIIDAHNQIYEIGGVVNPRLTGHDISASQDIVPARGDIGQTTHFVDFDISVTTSEDVSGKIGAGISVGILSIGSTASAKDGNSHFSRIKFKIPVWLPHGHRAKLADKPSVTENKQN